MASEACIQVCVLLYVWTNLDIVYIYMCILTEHRVSVLVKRTFKVNFSNI